MSVIAIFRQLSAGPQVCDMPGARNDFSREEPPPSKFQQLLGHRLPEKLRRNTVFHDRGDYYGRTRTDHLHAPGDRSLLWARYIFVLFRNGLSN